LKDTISVFNHYFHIEKL